MIYILKLEGRLQNEKLGTFILRDTFISSVLRLLCYGYYPDDGLLTRHVIPCKEPDSDLPSSYSGVRGFNK